MAKAQINYATLILLVLTFNGETDGVDSFGCKGETSCQTVPSSCTDASCSLGVTVVKTNDGQYAFYAQGPGGSDSYVAVGISKDNSMGEDAVVACTSGGVILYENPASHDASVAKNWKSGSPSSKSFAVADGKLTCSFTLPKVVEVSDSLTLKVSESYILVASGPNSLGGTNHVSFKGIQHHTNWVSEKLDLGNSDSGEPISEPGPDEDPPGPDPEPTPKDKELPQPDGGEPGDYDDASAHLLKTDPLVVIFLGALLEIFIAYLSGI